MKLISLNNYGITNVCSSAKKLEKRTSKVMRTDKNNYSLGSRH